MTLTPEQHAIRATGLGGADAAAALGLSRFKTPYQLYREKRDGIAPEVADAEAAEWGHILEPAVATKWSRETGREVIELRGYTRRSVDHPFMVGSIDRGIAPCRIETVNGRIVDAAVSEGLECKAWGFAGPEWGEAGTDEIPADVVAQVVHYLIVYGAERWHVALLHGARKFRRYVVERDPELIEMVIEGERAFWRMVEDGKPPPITTLADARLAWPRSTEREIEATPAVAEAVERLRQLKADAKRIDGELAALELTVKAHMADASVLTVRGVQVATWKTGKPRAGYTVAPQIEGSRTFRIKD